MRRFLGCFSFAASALLLPFLPRLASAIPLQGLVILAGYTDNGPRQGETWQLGIEYALPPDWNRVDTLRVSSSNGGGYGAFQPVPERLYCSGPPPIPQVIAGLPCILQQGFLTPGWDAAHDIETITFANDELLGFSSFSGFDHIVWPHGSAPFPGFTGDDWLIASSSTNTNSGFTYLVAIVPVPEPAGWILSALGVGVLALVRSRQHGWS